MFGEILQVNESKKCVPKDKGSVQDAQGHSVDFSARSKISPQKMLPQEKNHRLFQNSQGFGN